MGLQQKSRSLFCGLQAGLGFVDLNGERVIHLSDAPYELEPIISRWLDALPSELLMLDSPHAILRRGKGVAITEQGWEYFVCWMLETLTEAQLQADFSDKIKESINGS